MADLNKVRERLGRLQDRLADGGLDTAAFQQQLELLLVGLSPEERAQVLGAPLPETSLPFSVTPASAPPSPWPVTPAKTPFPSTARMPESNSEKRPMPAPVLGPSGPAGGGLRTAVPHLIDLNLSPGTVLFDQWRIVRELGRGGFGAVFEAEDIRIGAPLAVKVLDPAMAAREELLARFRREVALARQLVSPRIVRVFDYREDMDQHLAIVTMELVRGCTVRDLMVLARENHQAVPLELALHVLREVLEALAAAHEQRVIHQDVKPANILLAGGTAAELITAWNQEPDDQWTDDAADEGSPDALRDREVPLDPQVKLTDFGIARLLEPYQLSQRSQVLGTFGYLAPELLDTASEVTPAADVYSAGAVAYELLCGKVPVMTHFRSLAALRTDLPKGVARLFRQLTHSEPANRPTPPAAVRRIQALLRERSRKPMGGSVDTAVFDDGIDWPADAESTDIVDPGSTRVKCPLDDRWNRRNQTFRCRRCGREHLCLAHLEPTHNICTQCADQRRADGARCRAEEEARRKEYRQATTIQPNHSEELPKPQEEGKPGWMIHPDLWDKRNGY